MDLKHSGFPVPSDYFGVLWALSGIRDLLVLEHGSTGTCNYNAFNYMIMNRQTPKGKLFSSGMDEDDVVMGRDEKIRDAIAELDCNYHPKMIALVATGVTSVIGLDLKGIIEEIQPTTNARLLSFSSGGFAGDYTAGIREVFGSLARDVADDGSKDASTKADEFTVNIIGPTIDSFNIVSDLAEIERMLGLMGVRVNTVFTCNTDVDSIRSLGCASLNLVTRDIGLEAAEILKERFGTPYYYGLPFGVRGSIEWMKDISGILGIELDRKVLKAEVERYGFSILELANHMQNFDHLKAMISCPPDYSIGLAAMMREEWGIEPALMVLPAYSANVQSEEQGSMQNSTKARMQDRTRSMTRSMTRARIQAAEVDGDSGTGKESELLIEPDGQTLKEAIDSIKPQIIFGNSYDLKIAKDVPIRIHAAFPAFDHIYRYDGTPFVGLRGHAYLTQLIINQLNLNPEVFRN